jgi:hypothetical protein
MYVMIVSRSEDSEVRTKALHAISALVKGNMTHELSFCEKIRFFVKHTCFHPHFLCIFERLKVCVTGLLGTLHSVWYIHTRKLTMQACVEYFGPKVGRHAVLCACGFSEYVCVSECVCIHVYTCVFLCMCVPARVLFMRMHLLLCMYV